MAELQRRDFRLLNESVLALHGDTLSETLAARLGTAVSLLMPCDVAAVERFDSGAAWIGRTMGSPARELQRHFPAFLHVMGTHPLFPLFVSGRLQQQAFRISDVMGESRLRQLAIFADFLRPLGVDRQMAVALQLGDGTAEVLVLSRKGADFSAGERARLSAFLPHYRAARQSSLLSPKGVRRCMQEDTGHAAECREMAPLRAALGLTEREAEIVWWLTRGKSDRDIGEICGISRRTVQKHCENIYRKAGVECRTATVVRALECR